MSGRRLVVGCLKYEVVTKNDKDFICEVDNDYCRVLVGSDLSKEQLQVSLLECAILIVLNQIGYYKQQRTRRIAASAATLLRQYLKDNNIFRKITKLKLCGSNYTVRYRDNKSMPDSYGEIDVAKTEILIANYLNRDTRALTFMHEMTHSMMHQLGEDGLYGDEKFVCAFSYILFSVVKDNRKLLFR
jgi:hypothetical protein